MDPAEKCVWFDLDISPGKTNRRIGQDKTNQDEKMNQDEPRRVGPFKTNQTKAALSGWPLCPPNPWKRALIRAELARIGPVVTRSATRPPELPARSKKK
ncbi:MAG TPA: hypothetical protein VKI65_04445, partial [Gemmataceae bacterium]|nr:hypothetical protein [Gemmataceae bacterium]